MCGFSFELTDHEKSYFPGFFQFFWKKWEMHLAKDAYGRPPDLLESNFFQGFTEETKEFQESRLKENNFCDFILKRIVLVKNISENGKICFFPP